MITFRGGAGAIRESSDIIIDPSSLLQTGDWRFWTDVFTTVPLDKKEESLSSIEESESRSELAVDNREISVGKKCCLIVWTSSFSCCDKTCEAVNDRYWWSEIPVNVIVELYVVRIGNSIACSLPTSRRLVTSPRWWIQFDW